MHFRYLKKIWTDQYETQFWARIGRDDFVISLIFSKFLMSVIQMCPHNLDFCKTKNDPHIGFYSGSLKLLKLLGFLKLLIIWESCWFCIIIWVDLVLCIKVHKIWYRMVKKWAKNSWRKKTGQDFSESHWQRQILHVQGEIWARMVLVVTLVWSTKNWSRVKIKLIRSKGVN